MFAAAMILSAARARLPAWTQLGTFVTLGIGRQFLFSSFFASVLQNFGTRAYGRLIGAAGLLAGSGMLAMNPMLRVVLGPAFSGNFTTVQLLQLGCVVVVSPFPWWLHKRSRARFSATSMTAP